MIPYDPEEAIRDRKWAWIDPEKAPGGWTVATLIDVHGRMIRDNMPRIHAEYRRGAAYIQDLRTIQDPRTPVVVGVQVIEGAPANFAEAMEVVSAEDRETLPVGVGAMDFGSVGEVLDPDQAGALDPDEIPPGSFILIVTSPAGVSIVYREAPGDDPQRGAATRGPTAPLTGHPSQPILPA